MSGDYLWDRTGSDPDVEKLERLLRPLALDDRGAAPRPAPAPSFRIWLTALAAAGLFAMVVTQLVRPPAPKAEPAAYQVTVPGRNVAFSCGPSTWVAEPRLERRIDLAGLGHVIAEADAQVRVVRISDEEHRLRLEKGTIHARIGPSCRPRLFQVETPATTCIDLGCTYTLSVDAQGRAQVRVEGGQVAFQDGGREVYIPAGAGCSAVPGRGSGLPRWDDTPADVAQAADHYDAAPRGRRASEATELAARVSRPKDTLILWHLLQDDETAVIRIADTRLEALAGRPAEAPAGWTKQRNPKALKGWKGKLAELWE